MNHTNTKLINKCRNNTASRTLKTVSSNQLAQNINLSVVFITSHNLHPQLTILLLKTCPFSSKELTSRLKTGATKLLMTIYSLIIKAELRCKLSTLLSPSKASLRSQLCLQNKKTSTEEVFPMWIRPWNSSTEYSRNSKV